MSSTINNAQLLINENLHTHHPLLVELLIKINGSSFFTGGSPVWGTWFHSTFICLTAWRLVVKTFLLQENN